MLGVTSDTANNIYVTGVTYGGLDGNTLTGSCDLFVTKYDSNGTKQWTRQLGVVGSCANAHGITSDSGGNIYVAGVTGGALGGQTYVGVGDLFVTKYNSSGVKQWTRLLGIASGGAVWVYGITSDTGDNVYVTGEATGNLDGNTMTGASDLFVTKYNSSGVKQWTKLLGVAAKNTLGQAVTSDANNNIYVAGYTNGGLDGNTNAGGSGYFDTFITKYDSAGVKQWTRQMGITGNNVIAFGITKDAASNVYATGITSGGLDGSTSSGGQDFFITKFDSAGSKQ